MADNVDYIITVTPVPEDLEEPFVISSLEEIPKVEITPDALPFSSKGRELLSRKQDFLPQFEGARGLDDEVLAVSSSFAALTVSPPSTSAKPASVEEEEVPGPDVLSALFDKFIIYDDDQENGNSEVAPVEIQAAHLECAVLTASTTVNVAEQDDSPATPSPKKNRRRAKGKAQVEKENSGHLDSVPIVPQQAQIASGSQPTPPARINTATGYRLHNRSAWMVACPWPSGNSCCNEMVQVDKFGAHLRNAHYQEYTYINGNGETRIRCMLPRTNGSSCRCVDYKCVASLVRHLFAGSSNAHAIPQGRGLREDGVWGELENLPVQRCRMCPEESSRWTVLVGGNEQNFKIHIKDCHSSSASTGGHGSDTSNEAGASEGSTRTSSGSSQASVGASASSHTPSEDETSGDVIQFVAYVWSTLA